MMVSGTSPRTRGKRVHADSDSANCWNIPAHAGKTFFRRIEIVGIGEHPRARGENHSASGTSPRALGTSPRTRGKRCGVCIIGRCQGNIPAHAGKTGHGCGRVRGTGEHPRARGENFFTMREEGREYGTSPRTRGKRRRNGPGFPQSGNIPAHAGKTQAEH